MVNIIFMIDIFNVVIIYCLIYYLTIIANNKEVKMEWITHIITFLVGLGAGWSIKVVLSSNKKIAESNNKTIQTGNKVKNGSIVGRNQSDSHR